jgi:hypothetical protein
MYGPLIYRVVKALASALCIGSGAPGDASACSSPRAPCRYPAGESASPVAGPVTPATGDPVKPELGPQQDPAREQN